jgi:hypothetical protein
MQEISDFDENLVNFFPMSSRKTRIAVHGLGWFTQKKGAAVVRQPLKWVFSWG